jgi:hypothetical protein
MKTRQHIVGGILVGLLMFNLASYGDAAQNATDRRVGEFVFGAALGLQADTADDTAVALGFYGDYYLTQELSVGPLLQVGVTDDLEQFGLTAQVKYTFDLPDTPELKPHVQAGLGFIHAELDRPWFRNEDDTSFLIPLGVGLDYQLTDSVSLDNTLLFNFTNLDVRDENFFLTWLIGCKFRF